ncbi:LOW QUALITY PROTEIN: bestrophin-4 [Hipposideros larvatus]
MTVLYTLKVAEAHLGGFSGLFLCWRGSIYKLLYKEFLLFIFLHALLSIAYRLLLTQERRYMYAQVARYCNCSADLILLSFVLGFYVTLVVNRWWAQYTNTPLPDQLMCVVSASVHGVDQRGHLLRLTLVRANLASAVSTCVLKRFPTMEQLIPASFMSQEERKKFESLKSNFNKYWVPCVWFTNLVAQARRDEIRDDIALCLLLEYSTTVMTIAVYSYFALSLVGHQFVEPEAGAAKPQEPLKPGQEPGPALGNMDMYVPLTILLQFFFHAGWLKVAKQIINPFGEDDDDFETNQLIWHNLQISRGLEQLVGLFLPASFQSQCGEERGIFVTCCPPQVSLLSVDDMYQNPPPAERPYAVATVAGSLTFFLGSTFNLRVSDHPEQILQGVASPGSYQRVPAAQTTLLSRFLGAGEPFPAVSLENFGRAGDLRTPHLLRFRVEEGGDPEAGDCIEGTTGSGDQAQEP